MMYFSTGTTKIVVECLINTTMHFPSIFTQIFALKFANNMCQTFPSNGGRRHLYIGPIANVQGHLDLFYFDKIRAGVFESHSHSAMQK